MKRKKAYEFRRVLTIFGGPQVEFRADHEEDEGVAKKIRGHAAVVGVEQEIWPGFREVIAPGAFAEALERPDDVRALWNHDANIVLGRNTAGTLELSEDRQGLAYVIDPPDTQLIRDMVISPIDRGDVTGSSFGFHVDADSEVWEEDGSSVLRTVESLTLVDVSPVTFPAYPAADVAMRGVLASKDPEVAGDLLRRILEQDLTDDEIRSLLAGQSIPKRNRSQAPASTDLEISMIDIRRRRLDLDRLDAEG